MIIILPFLIICYLLPIAYYLLSIIYFLRLFRNLTKRI